MNESRAFECIRHRKFIGPPVEGMHPVKVASQAGCERLCTLKIDCQGFVYNLYRNCYLKSDPLGELRVDNPIHQTVSCRMTSRSRCTMENISSAMPPGSKALRKYIRLVYGRGAGWQAAPSWNWSHIDYIHFNYLPGALRRLCSWKLDRPERQGDVFHKTDFGGLFSPPESLWHYRHEKLCTGDEASKGGARGPPRVLDGTWREVSHVYVKHSLERKAVYMYAARGSGLWYYTGKTIIVSDHYDLALHVNMKAVYERLDAQAGRGRGGPEGVSVACFDILRRQGFHTVIFDKHVDWASADMTESGKCVHSFYVTEIINIRQSPVVRSCPPEPVQFYARGWNGSESCHCVANTPNTWTTNHIHDARSVWPYAWVQCADSRVPTARMQKASDRQGDRTVCASDDGGTCYSHEGVERAGNALHPATCKEMFVESASPLYSAQQQRWGTQPFVLRRAAGRGPTCLRDPHLWRQLVQAIESESQPAACSRDWNPGVKISHHRPKGVEPLVGYDSALLAFCTPSERALAISTSCMGCSHSGISAKCAAAGFNVLRLTDGWTMCLNAIWLVCALRGWLPGQHREGNAGRITFATAPAAIDGGSLTTSSVYAGRQDAWPCRSHSNGKVECDGSRYPVGDVTLTEMCLIARFCRNGDSIFGLQRNGTFTCDFDAHAARTILQSPIQKEATHLAQSWWMDYTQHHPDSLARAHGQGPWLWPGGHAGIALPHCRRVEILHIPKASGQALLSALDQARAPFCYTETWCDRGGLRRIGGSQGCGCKPCSESELETIGVHERRFGAGEGSFGRGNPHTLYLSIIREPTSWLKSLVAHTCREEPSLRECHSGRIDEWYQGPHHEHSPLHRFFGFVTWYHTLDLQSHLLEGIFAARNWMICTLEQRDTIISVLEVVLGRALPRKLVADAHAFKALPVNFTSDLSAGRYSHLYHADAALYAHVARSGGCIYRMRNLWQRQLSKLLTTLPSLHANVTIAN